MEVTVENYDSMTDAQFDALPLIAEGSSKIVRRIDQYHCAIRYKPTVYSFTHNREGIVEGTDKLRMRATRAMVEAVRRTGVNHAYIEVGERFVLSLIISRPPPIEVIVKRFHEGTSKHRYYGMGESTVRSTHPFHGGKPVSRSGAYPEPFVRFDWRNPMRYPETGERMADEPMCDSQADWFINVARASGTALHTFASLSSFLGKRNIVLYDLCLFISEDGETVFGEISQDCGRFRHYDLGSLDKDVWRGGGSSADVAKKWALLADLVEQPPVTPAP